MAGLTTLSVSEMLVDSSDLPGCGALLGLNFCSQCPPCPLHRGFFFFFSRLSPGDWSPVCWEILRSPPSRTMIASILPTAKGFKKANSGGSDSGVFFFFFSLRWRFSRIHKIKWVFYASTNPMERKATQPLPIEESVHDKSMIALSPEFTPGSVCRSIRRP